jgi:hypothetical protein
MKKKSQWIAVFLLVFGFLAAPAAPAAGQALQPQSVTDAEGPWPDSDWPQIVEGNDSTLTIYQPQFEEGQNNLLTGKTAFSVTTKASPQETYGMLTFSAWADVDRKNKTVSFRDIRIVRVHFPRSDSDAAEYRALIESSIPNWPASTALDRFQANLAIAKAENKAKAGTAIRNDVPRVYFSTTPAFLVLVDGAPVLRPLEGTDLMRIINTRALMVMDRQKSRYYLYLTDHWEEAPVVEGPWAAVTDPSPSLDRAKEIALTTGQVDLLESAGDRKIAAPSTVFVSTVPADLLQTRGKPEMEPVDGTHLLAVKNTEDSIFLFLDDQMVYVLLIGRWYRGKSLADGPWEYVAAGNLPRDFALIPENHPKGTVLASVSGTPQAEEAAIANTVPRTVLVKRSEAKADIAYDGEPRFVKIEGTPLRYAVNTAVPVIQVDQKTYYSVQNGVWFVATSRKGPWSVASMVPAVIYTIPPGCPIHYVTYVKIYDATPDVVYVGYTPGYYNAFIGADGTVVYGTGYIYRPWIGAYWIGLPITWGGGVRYGWYADGLGWGFAFGWRPVFRPWWGPMRAWGPGWWHPWGWPGGVRVGFNVYGHWGSHVVVRNAVVRNRTVIQHNRVIHGRTSHPAGSRPAAVRPDRRFDGDRGQGPDRVGPDRGEKPDRLVGPRSGDHGGSPPGKPGGGRPAGRPRHP